MGTGADRAVTAVLIALGSNVGDALSHLRESVDALEAVLRVIGTSGVYRTAPMYVTDQPPFLNAALAAETELGPLPLLHLLKRTEERIGRTAAPRCGPREIDIDLIAYGSASYRFSDRGEIVLAVPHPRVDERRFVLQPLHDVAPLAVLPGLGSVAELLAKTIGQEGDVVRLVDAVLPLHGKG